MKLWLHGVAGYNVHILRFNLGAQFTEVQTENCHCTLCPFLQHEGDNYLTCMSKCTTLFSKNRSSLHVTTPLA